MMEQDQILQMINYKDSFVAEKSKNVIGLIEGYLGCKLLIEFIALRTKTYSYLIENNDEKQKTQKSVP